jgi:NhaA family Na+:H+ antiporter
MGVYVVIGGFAWLALLESGVHATLAGVALGLLTPAHAMYSDEEYRQRATWILSRYDMDARAPRARERLDQQALELAAVARESVSPLDRLEVAIHPWSSFVIVPIFALANAGIRFADIDVGDAITSPVAMGVALGLVVGKTVGVSLFAFLAVRLGLGTLPKATTWRHIVGVAIVAGIGFTVSLFITELAFTAPELIDRAKIGIFIGSGFAGIAGYLLLRSAPQVSEPSAPKAPESAVAVPGR